mmetsp:Transcript_3516/g.9388  ORF Transcript_3516/g.9388 Transcript_3516/m.9388 type:complete len:201 (+) Transcript_3516:711-1313(+)
MPQMGAKTMSARARLPRTRPTDSGFPSLATSDGNSPPQKAFSAPIKKRAGSRTSVSCTTSTRHSACRSVHSVGMCGCTMLSRSKTLCASAIALVTGRRGRTSTKKHSELSAATIASTLNIIDTLVACTRAEDEKLPTALPPMKADQNIPDQRPRFESVVHAVKSEPCDTQSSPAPRPSRVLADSCAECHMGQAHVKGKGA